MTTRPSVLIIGGGPAGLTLAHALAKRDALDITVVERDPAPFDCPTTTDRSYTIDITGHGLRAVRYLDAVEAFDRQLLAFKGVRMHRPIRKHIPWTDSGWTGSRGDILKVLLGDLNAKYPGRVQFRWQTRVEAIDAVSGQVQLDGARQAFDLIVGCDGAGAVTRRALAALPGITLDKGSLPNYCMMVQLDQRTDALDPEWLHVVNSHPFTVAGAVNGADKHDPRWFCMVGFNHEHRFGSGCCGPRSQRGRQSDAVEDARRYFERHTEILPCISDAELARLVERRCHHIGRSVKCSSLHGGKLVLIGDAGCAFPPVGQGINAAMESAIVLDQALENCGGGGAPEQLLEAAVCYEQQWKPEADAAEWIATRWAFSNVRMSAKMLMAEYLDCNVLSQAKHMPYSEVYAQAQKRNKWLGPLERLLAP